MIKRIDIIRRNFFGQGNEYEKIPPGQMGRGCEKQERRGCGGSRI